MDFLMMLDPVLLALIATVFCWSMTALGSASVFFFKRVDERVSDAMLGFSSGIMIAASFWSLLSPALELAEGTALPSYIIAAAGFSLGALATLVCDAALSRLQSERDVAPSKRKLALLVGAITVHNIPEGLAVGVAFGALSSGMNAAALASALSVAFGIALQNFPEGAAVSIPMRETGMSRKRSFFFGQLSGMAEPVSGVLGALLVSIVRPILPFALSFAAGSMIFVVVQELIPEPHAGKRSYLASFGCIIGFIIMMVMDVALG